MAIYCNSDIHRLIVYPISTLLASKYVVAEVIICESKDVF